MLSGVILIEAIETPAHQTSIKAAGGGRRRVMRIECKFTKNSNHVLLDSTKEKKKQRGASISRSANEASRKRSGEPGLCLDFDLLSEVFIGCVANGFDIGCKHKLADLFHFQFWTPGDLKDEM